MPKRPLNPRTHRIIARFLSKKRHSTAEIAKIVSRKYPVSERDVRRIGQGIAQRESAERKRQVALRRSIFRNSLAEMGAGQLQALLAEKEAQIATARAAIAKHHGTKEEFQEKAMVYTELVDEAEIIENAIPRGKRR